MNKVNFPIGDLLTRSWEVFVPNALPLIGATVLMSLIVAVGNSVLLIAGSLIAGPLVLGLFKMAKDSVAGRPAQFNDMFVGFQEYLAPSLLANIFITIFTVIGSIFCVIPGLVVVILYLPTYLIIIDDKSDFWVSMEASRAMVMDNFLQWALLFLVICAINFAGTLLCFIGLFVTIPISVLLIVMAYEMERQGAPGESSGDIPYAAPPLQ